MHPRSERFISSQWRTFPINSAIVLGTVPSPSSGPGPGRIDTDEQPCGSRPACRCNTDSAQHSRRTVLSRMLADEGNTNYIAKCLRSCELRYVFFQLGSLPFATVLTISRAAAILTEEERINHERQIWREALKPARSWLYQRSSAPCS